jgi:hypothetical protein
MPSSTHEDSIRWISPHVTDTATVTLEKRLSNRAGDLHANSRLCGRQWKFRSEVDAWKRAGGARGDTSDACG